MPFAPWTVLRFESLTDSAPLGTRRGTVTAEDTEDSDLGETIKTGKRSDNFFFYYFLKG